MIITNFKLLLCHAPQVIYLSISDGPGGNIPQHTKLNKLSDGQVKELPGNVVKPAKTGKNNKKREKMKISLMQGVRFVYNITLYFSNILRL